MQIGFSRLGRTKPEDLGTLENVTRITSKAIPIQGAPATPYILRFCRMGEGQVVTGAVIVIDLC